MSEEEKSADEKVFMQNLQKKCEKYIFSLFCSFDFQQF